MKKFTWQQICKWSRQIVVDGIGQGCRDLHLRICEHFEKKAQAIRLKRSNPKEYEDQVVLDEISQQLSYFVQRVNKGKSLSRKDQALLTKIYLLVDGIESSKENNEKARNLRQITIQLLPDLAVLDSVDRVVEEVVDSLKGSPKEAQELLSVLQSI